MIVDLKTGDLVVGVLVMTIFLGLIYHGFYTLVYMQDLHTNIDFS